MSYPSNTIEALEAELKIFDPERRARALEALQAQIERRGIGLSPEMAAVNMHCHTFYSFNAYGYSPSGLAWLARQRSFRAVGIVDFDVLDGVDEFLDRL